MALKFFEIELRNIGKQKYLRLDFGYRYFFDIQDAAIYQNSNLVKLKYVLKEVHSKKVKKGELDDEQYLIDIGNIERRFNNLINIEKVNSIGSDKTVLQNGDIIIPKMQPQMGNIFLNLEHKKYIGSTELLEYKISNDYKPRFLYYLITSRKFLSNLAKLESGKTHRRVNPIDLLKIKIPKIPKPIQDQIVARIEPIEQKIKQLKSQIKPPQEIINKVFAREFGFDLEKFKETKKEKFFEVELKMLNTPLIRSTVIQNSLSTTFLKNFLTQTKTIYLKNILVNKIHRGKQPEYTNEGIKVIKTANIQNGEIIFDEVLQYVSRDFYFKNIKKTGIQKFDLLLTSTGMGRGKFALYDIEEKAFADSHISIIRFNTQKINPYFLKYYSQSLFGTEQLKYIEMQIKGTPEIYEEQLKYFQIPNIPLSRQQKIVDEIKAELDQQKKIEKEIEALRNEIDKIIEEVIK